jgi:hypothetical protein
MLFKGAREIFIVAASQQVSFYTNLMLSPRRKTFGSLKNSGYLEIDVRRGEQYRIPHLVLGLQQR